MWEKQPKNHEFESELSSYVIINVWIQYVPDLIVKIVLESSSQFICILYIVNMTEGES